MINIRSFQIINGNQSKCGIKAVDYITKGISFEITFSGEQRKQNCKETFSWMLYLTSKLEFLLSEFSKKLFWKFIQLFSPVANFFVYDLRPSLLGIYSVTLRNIPYFPSKTTEV